MECPLGKLTVSKLSSAHVYLRQPEGQPHGDWDALPAALVNDAAQLVKANSIEGKFPNDQVAEQQLVLWLAWWGKCSLSVHRCRTCSCCADYRW